MPTPSKFTAPTRETILEVKRVGGPDTLACAAARITVTTLNRWLDKGKKAEEGSYAEFFEAYQEAKAHPKVRALGLLYKKLPDSDSMLWKYVERQVDGYAPPAPLLPATTATGPVTINLSLTGGTELPQWIDAEVMDAKEIPALGDGNGSADTAASTGDQPSAASP